MDLVGLINKILALLATELKPKPSHRDVGMQTLKELLASYGIHNVYFFDKWYYFTSLKEWDEMFWDILAKLPYYIPEQFDCDDFSLVVKTRFAAIGNTPKGYHAWNVFLASEGIFFLEPQTGMHWRADDTSEGYIADWVLI